jgi:uncharacterized surface anchored protein
VFTLYTDPTPGTGDSETAIDADDTPVMIGTNPVTCTTTSAGTCSFQSVNQGDYWVVETLTPSGYQTAPSQEATIGIGASPSTGPTVNLTFVDPLAPATINVTKTDQNGIGLAGAVFQLFRGTTQAGSCTTADGSNNTTLGKCSFGSFTGTGTASFTVHELTPPNGYSGSTDQSLTFTFGNTPQTVPFTFSDTPVPGTIKVQKNDSNGHGLAGAVFTLYQNGAPVPLNGANETCTTDSSGACSFTNVALGTYSVVESTTPSGYETAAPQTVTIGLGSAPNTGDTETKTFVDPAAPATLDVVKTDPNGVGLPGAVFQLLQGTTVKASCTTGDGTNNTTLGECSFGQFTGTGTVSYTVHEQTPPNGYSGSTDQPLTVTYGNVAQTLSVTFTDTPVPGRVSITKTDDASPANVLAGATFALYSDTELGVATDSPTQVDADDHPVTGATCTTDSTGTCSITSVPPGSYTVFETTTPAGHQTAPAQDVIVALGTTPGGGDTENLTFVDPRLHKVIVLVCSEGTNTLDGSSVSFDGGTSTMTSLETGASLTSGITEAGLCGLGGATKSDLPEGALSPNVQINVK